MPGASDRKLAVVVGIAIGVVFTVPAMWLAYISTGAGHGSYNFARLFFPFSMLLATVTGEINNTLIALACVQFPSYGALIGMHWSNGRRRGWVFCILAAAHALAVSVCFFGWLPWFS